MGRPRKAGVEFFPLDTGFFRDDKVKLLRAEFGAKGMYLLIYLLCEIYEKNGYYMQWDSDRCYLASDGAGCACSPEFVSEFVRGCVARSFFDERVFNVFGVLTSASIQRRYLAAVRKRPNIEMIEDYFLLDLSCEKDNPGGSLANCTLKKITSAKTPVSAEETPVKAEKTPQSKVKYINTHTFTGACAPERERDDEEKGEEAGRPAAAEIAAEFARLKCKDPVTEAEAFSAYNESRGWSGADWHLKAALWAKRAEHVERKGGVKKQEAGNMVNGMVSGMNGIDLDEWSAAAFKHVYGGDLFNKYEQKGTEKEGVK